MLVLSRHRSENIVLDFSQVIALIDTDPEQAKAALSRVNICVVDIRGDKTRLGLDADKRVSVHRDEVQAAIDRRTQSQTGAEV